MFAAGAALGAIVRLLGGKLRVAPLSDDTRLGDSTAAREALLVQWRAEQTALASSVSEIDDHPSWSIRPAASPDTPASPTNLKLIGGVDMSFIKGNDLDALAMLVVLSYPALEVVYEASAMVQLTAPYISGFLAFREAPHLLQLLSHLKREQPSLYPDVLFVDGNGVLHPARLGLASYLGVVAGVPSIGIGKSGTRLGHYISCVC
jgi:deoxyinosine 3'endonuclease (endonuclease V)